jgi:hypothetical protein
MKLKSKVKNTVLAGLAGLTLTACGGGGGGGAAGVIDNFVDNDLTNLSGSVSLVSSYSTLLSDFQSVISSGDISAIQGVITGPDQNDIAQANTLLTQLATAQTLWEQTEDLINDQNDTDKYAIYNSDSFKEAHAAMLYLQNHVKPIIQKVANGNTITLTDYNLVSKSERANEIIEQEKNSTSNDYANTKKIKSVETITNDTDASVDSVGDSTITYTDWATVYAGGGDEQRTKTTSVANLRTTTTTRCTFTRTTLLNGTTTDGAQTCTVVNTATTDLDPTVTTETETRTGENPVTATVNLDDNVSTTTEETTEQTTTTYTDAENTTTETQEGSATTNTANRDVTTTTNHGDNTSTIVVTRYVDTTTTTPINTRIYRTRHFTDTVTKQTRTKTTTTPQQQVTYKDGTTEVIDGSATVTYTDWTTVTVSMSSRSENILESESTAEQVVTTSDAGTQLSSQLVSNAYTDNDTNLGTVTANMSATVADHQTAEYNANHGLGMINAADAYAKGWTGEGAVLGVIDTWQDTDHEKLDGKYLFYKDYDPYNGTVDEGAQGHGTFVASIIAGKRDGDSTDSDGRLTTGDYSQETYWENGQQQTRYTLSKNNDMHGVAFNSNLVGANVDRFSSGGISKSQAQNALHDFAKLKSPTSEGGEEMNIVAVNMSFNTPQLFYEGAAKTSTVTQLSDGTYNASEVIAKIQGNGYGDSQYWKIATDNDIILVNSAGNYGFAHAGDPGIWAVETDSNGDLILGGKMVIVGNWDGSNVSGNKAGHVCLDINTVNNTCNDTHRLSEFYILAPGTNIQSAISDDRYTSGSGTSYAAPHVTGAFGVLNQMWPYMAGDKLVKLVMNTADKNLSGYDVNIHGQGLLDLDEATKPQGAVGLATSGRVDHPTVSLNNTYYSTGTYLPSSLSNLKIMVLDDYDRNYYIDLGSSFVVQDKRKFSDVQMLVDNKNTFLPHQQMYGSFAQGGQYDLANNYNFGFYTGENGSGDYSLNVGKDFYLNDKFKLKTNIGHMSEQETWLGNDSDGVLAVGDNNATTSLGIGVAYQLGNNVLSLDYSKGNTNVNTTDNSLIKSFSDVETESYRLAYEIHKDTHTTFGWSFSLPSHITSGTMDLEVAESVNLDGTINYTDINSDLAQGTKEKNIGFYFNKSGEEELDASFNFTAEYRMDKSGVANNDGVEVGMNFVKKFAGNCKFLWMKNPKCFNEDGNMKANLFGKNTDNATKHGLVYDLETDKFIPINKQK